jgi:RNA-binding protein PNO1
MVMTAEPSRRLMATPEDGDAQPMVEQEGDARQALRTKQTGADVEMAVVPPPKPEFGPLSAHEMGGGKFQFRKVFVPAHRYTPIKEHWMEIYTPIFEQMKIDIRMNLKVCITVSGSRTLSRQMKIIGTVLCAECLLCKSTGHPELYHSSPIS